MICIKTICGSMQQWNMNVILPSRRSTRLQWCKCRQIAPRQGDLQMRRATVASCRGKFGDRTFHLSPWSKLVADQWPWIQMLKVSWRSWEPTPENVSWTFSVEKGMKMWRLPLGFCRWYYSSVSALGQERGAQYALTCWMGAIGGSFPLPAKPVLPSNYQRACVAS